MKHFILYTLIIVFVLSCETEKAIEYPVFSEAPLKTPQLFAEGIISTQENSEFDITFSADGRTVYFSRRAKGEKQKIYISEWKDMAWSTPIQADFSTDRDEAVSITPNGKYLFFGSERPIPNQPNKGNFDMNIWMMEESTQGWSEPRPLPFPINEVQQEGEEWPSSNNNFFFTLDNETYYFTTMKRGNTSIQLYETQFDGANFTEPKTISGLFEDEKYWVYSAVISPDGQYLLFNSFQAPGAIGGEDIFVSKKTVNGWSRAKSIGTLVNTKNEEGGARFSRDGRYFFFSRSDYYGGEEYGEWSIYWMETEYLNLAALFEE